MSKLTSHINRARKLIREKEKQNNANLNQLIICSEFNRPLNGELVILLKDKD